jgi:hypothetical protein
VPQDPAVIQRQIEDTRAELADTIDAIAEIVSPRRVAERAGVQVRLRVAELRARLAPSDGATDGPQVLTGETPGVGSGTLVAAASPGYGVGAADGPGSGPEAGSGAPRRAVRWDRVALAAGATTLLLVGSSRRRRRRRA